MSDKNKLNEVDTNKSEVLKCHTSISSNLVDGKDGSHLTTYASIKFINHDETKDRGDMIKSRQDVPSVTFKEIETHGPTCLFPATKHKLMNTKELGLMKFQDRDMKSYDENMPLKTEETESPPPDKSAFLMVLGIIPGLIGLVIAVGVVGIWMIQKNSTWSDRNNPGAEPTTSSHAQAKPTVLPCNI